MTPFFRSYAIFRPGRPGMPHCHAPTILEAAPGVLLAAWFGGTHEGHSDVTIWLARAENGQWSDPIRAVREPGVPLWNPVLFRDAHGCVWLFYKVGPSVPAWTGAFTRSTDIGETWSPPTYLPAGLLGPAKNKPIILSNGDILCGSSAEAWGSWACWVEISQDGGAHWSKHGPIALPWAGEHRPSLVSAVWDREGSRLLLPDNFAGVIQPTAWEYAPGRLKMLTRATRRIGRVCRSSSDDFGRTWTPPEPTELLNPNSGVDVARLADGRLVLAYNPSASERSPLALALSEDNGETWPHVRVLEADPGEFSYPSIIEGADGILHLVYTCRRTHIQYVALERDWILQSAERW